MTIGLTKVGDLSVERVSQIISRAFDFKTTYDKGIRRQNLLDGRAVALIFEKPSLRTKVAFEVATTSLGGSPVYLSSSQILASGNDQRGRESIPDIGRNLERFTDLLVARVYSHSSIVELQSSVSRPVINALCDQHHPTQALADLMAIQWHRPDWQGLTVAFVGDGNNVATSQGFDVPEKERTVAEQLAKSSKVSLRFTHSPEEAVSGADIIYTDTFISMGQEAEKQKRLEVFTNYQVNKELMNAAKPDALFMHCLPAHRGEEVTDEVMDSKQSIVFDQAECRMHIAKAVLAEYLGR